MSTDLKNLTIRDIAACMEQMGEPSYRAQQIFSWIYEKGAGGLDSMSDLPLKLR